MISVIIPTYNREDCLFNTLESFDEQKCSVDFEILVIDQSENPSNEKIERILNVRSKVHYYRINRAGRSIAKNAAIPLASGQVLLFVMMTLLLNQTFLIFIGILIYLILILEQCLVISLKKARKKSIIHIH